jgi:hypothetical protein
VFSWLALAGVMAYLHTAQPPTALGVTDGEANLVLSWIFVALLAGMVVAGGIASTVTRHYGLLAAVAAASVAGLVAVVGLFPLVAANGCVPPLATLWPSCAWRPEPAWSTLSFLAVPAYVLGVAAACGSAAVAAVVQRLLQARDWPTAWVSMPTIRPRGVLIRRVGAVALAALTIGLGVASGGYSPGAPSTQVTTATPAATPTAVDQPVSAQIKAQQVGAWEVYGGGDLLIRIYAMGNGYLSLLNRGKGRVDSSAVHPFCVGFDQLARDVSVYFQVPDPQGQSLWRAFITETRSIGQDCDQAVAHTNGDLLVRIVDELHTATITDNALNVRIIAASRAGGG